MLINNTGIVIGARQSIADPSFGKQVAWFGGLILDLGSELRHVKAQIVRVFHVVWTPHITEQLPVRDRIASATYQARQ